MPELLTSKTLRELLHYNPNNGVFTWKRRSRKYFNTDRAKNVWNGKYAEKEAGSDWCDPCSGKCYRQISVFNRRLTAHRLAWLYVTGNWPHKGIDHKDGNGMNNCWNNLRAANQSQNLANKGPNRQNSTGFKGVCLNKKTGKYIAQITVLGKNIFLGSHQTKIEAAKAYRTAALKYFGEFAYKNHRLIINT